MRKFYLPLVLLPLFTFSQVPLNGQCAFDATAGPDIYVCDPLPVQAQLNGEVYGAYGDITQTLWHKGPQWIAKNNNTPTILINQPAQYVFTAEGAGTENLIYNGDFDLGNTGFYTEYTHTPGAWGTFGTYDILSDPTSIGLPACGGQSPSGGNMYLGTGIGHGTGDELITWEQTIPVEPNTRYYFSYWAMSFFTFPSWPSTIGASINDGFVGYPLVLKDECRWYKAYGIWESGNNTSATIRFYKYTCDLPTFGLDDIFFSPLCTVKDTMSVYTGQYLQAILSPPTYTIPCDGSTISLNGMQSSQGPNLTYNWQTDDGYIVSGHNTLTPQVGAPGTYTLTVSPEIGIGDCAVSAAATVHEFDLQTWVVPPLSLSCKDSSVLLRGNSNQPGGVVYEWIAGPGGHIVSGANTRIAEVDAPGEYTFMATHLATGCTSEETVEVVENFTPPAINIQPPDTLGNGLDTLTLSASVTPANAIMQWATPDGNIVSGANTPNPLVNSGGTYFLTVTNPVNGCTSTSSVEVVQLNFCPLDVNAGNDINLFYCGQTVEVQLNGQISGDYFNVMWEPHPWTVQHGLSDTKILDPIASISKNMSYILKAEAISTENLIVNGDFEQGNTGFLSDLVYSPGDLTAIGTYDVLAIPETDNPDFDSCRDHTYGGGNMLAAVASDHLFNVWCQTVPVTPYTNYEFSCWGTKLFGPERSVAIIINTSPVTGGFLTPSDSCEWKEYSLKINSGALSSIQICIRAPKMHTGFYAFGIDDIRLSPYCEVSDTISIITQEVIAVANPPIYFFPCTGGGEITLSGEGSSIGPGIEYQWITDVGNIVSGANTLYPVVNAPGNYTLIVTASNADGSCIKMANVTVSQPNVSAWINAPSTLQCVPSTAILSGNTNLPAGTATFEWTALDNGNIVSGNFSPSAVIDQPGEYLLVVTQTASGCTGEASVTINPPNLPSASAGADTLSCMLSQSELSGAGSSSGSNFTYSWSTPDGKILSGQDSLYALTDTIGTYVLLVTNTANGCTATDTVLVSIDTVGPVPVLLPADTFTCTITEISLSVDSLSYTGPQLVFEWIAAPGGNIVSGGDSLAPVVNAPGWYTLLVTDTLSGCFGLDSVLVEADTMALVAIANAPEALSCTTFQVQLNADGSSSDSTIIYQWTTFNGNIVGGADTPTPTVDAPGIYQLQLTDSETGCSATDIAIVELNSEQPSVSVEIPEPLTCVQAQQTLQGENADPGGPYDYLWTASNGGNIVSGENTLTPEVDAAGLYTLLTTDTANGCTSQVTVQLDADFESPGAALTTSGNLNCHNSEVELTNNSPVDPNLLNHNWTNPDGTMGDSGTDPTWLADAPGEYLLLLTNTQNGCTSTASIIVIQHEAVLVEIAAQNDVSCFGASDGAASVVAGGGDGQFSYAWETGETTAVLTDLVAGTYNLTVTDGEDCTATLSLTIGQPDELLVNAVSTGVTAPGGNDGSASADPSGGTTPYSYLWNTGDQTQSVSGLSGGMYTVTVTDAQDCTAVETVEVFDGICELTVDVTGVDPACFGEASGSVTSEPASGTAPYVYAWSSGASEQTAENLPAGTYEVTVTDANDCAFTASVTLSDPPELSLLLIGVQNTDCPGNANGSATVEASGGSGNLEITWSDGQEGPKAVNLFAGIYNAAVMDANGCTTNIDITIEANDDEPPALAANPVPLPLGPAGSVTLTTQNLGLTASDNCAVQEVVFEPESFNCFQLGTQQVTAIATDASGNSSVLTFEVNVVDQTAPTVTCPADILRCAEDAIVEYVAPVAIDNCLALGGQFDLIEGLPSGEQFPEGTTVTTYTYTDFSGNVGQCSFEVTILSPLEILIDTIVHTISGQSMGSIQVTVSNSNPGNTYAWTANGEIIADTEDLFGVPAGEYTLLVTDANGCTQLSPPIVVDELVNSTDPSLQELIEVYPNPTSGKVFVVLPEALNSSEIRVLTFDARGRKVQERFFEKQKQLELNWSTLANGLYTIHLRTNFGQFVFRVSLKH